ncbi:hypothetical protein CH380_18070 [Leptospira adleri]|uniref:Uncharacterized protein n=1 Tax=Leptospira adleri TaxID=2023186 RepID=A0A2M9YJU0_9LEPT|nr:hypothetical protein CH380_18070 [Leptospira adleri]PJZ62291.1 hypothetical protein CH376_08765 [Leptospira adleri]
MFISIVPSKKILFPYKKKVPKEKPFFLSHFSFLWEPKISDSPFRKNCIALKRNKIRVLNWK